MDVPLPGAPASTEADRAGTEVETTAAGWPRTPTLPPHYVRRSRLLSLLDRAEALPLVLVSAPAGSGKTSLVADWCEASDAHDRTAWVTFERRGRGAVARAWSAAWSGSVSRCRRRRCPRRDGRRPQAARHRGLGGGRARHPADRGHRRLRAGRPQIVGRDLDFLLRHSGHRLRLVFLTRADPVLPLYRYRLEEHRRGGADRRTSLHRRRGGDLLLRQCGIALCPRPRSTRSTTGPRDGRSGCASRRRILEHTRTPTRPSSEVTGDTRQHRGVPPR